VIKIRDRFSGDPEKENDKALTLKSTKDWHLQMISGYSVCQN